MTTTAEGALPGAYPMVATAPAYALYDSRSVALATFLGSPVAGGVLMAMNYKRLGQAGRGAVTTFVCLLLTGLVILVGWNIPKGVSLPIALALMFGMQWASRALQGKAIESHVTQGGQLGSRGTAALIGLAFLVVLIAAIAIPVYMGVGNGPSIVENTKDNVYYTGDATKADAQALGDYLKDEKYLQGEGADVIVFKGKDQSGYNGTIVSFIVKEGSWNDPKMMGIFEQMTREVAPKLGGFPVEVRLLNKNRDVEKESVVGKADISGADHIYYFGKATDSDAHALGLALTKAGFLEGKGFDVFLWKQTEGTTIGFVVSAGAWDDAAIVADFERIVKQAAPSVGGLPVHLRLMNGQMETKKDEVVQ